MQAAFGSGSLALYFCPCFFEPRLQISLQMIRSFVLGDQLQHGLQTPHLLRRRLSTPVRFLSLVVLESEVRGHDAETIHVGWHDISGNGSEPSGNAGRT